MKAFVVRHGHSKKNVLQIVNYDPSKKLSLTDVGREQAAQIAMRLKSEHIVAVYTSELPRAVETGEIINQYHHAPLYTDRRLNELHNGVFEGEADSKFHAFVKGDRVRNVPPGAETLHDLKARLLECLSDIAQKEHGDVLIVTHGDPLSVLKQVAEGKAEIIGELPNYCDVLEYHLPKKR